MSRYSNFNPMKRELVDGEKALQKEEEPKKIKLEDPIEKECFLCEFEEIGDHEHVLESQLIQIPLKTLSRNVWKLNNPKENHFKTGGTLLLLVVTENDKTANALTAWQMGINKQVFDLKPDFFNLVEINRNSLGRDWTTTIKINGEDYEHDFTGNETLPKLVSVGEKLKVQAFWKPLQK